MYTKFKNVNISTYLEGFIMSKIISIENIETNIRKIAVSFIEIPEPLAKMADALKNASTSNEMEKQEEVLQNVTKIMENSCLKQSLESFKGLNKNDIPQLSKEIVNEISDNDGKSSVQPTIIEIEKYLDTLENYQYILKDTQEVQIIYQELRNFTNTVKQVVNETQLLIENEQDSKLEIQEDVPYWEGGERTPYNEEVNQLQEEEFQNYDTTNHVIDDIFDVT